MFKLFITTCLLLSHTLMAKELEPELKMKACLSNSANFTTAAMNNCVYQASVDWDSELNSIYRRLMEKLNPKAKVALKLSQRKWLEHRDLELSSIKAMYNDKRFIGSMYSNMQAAHRNEVIKNRVLELNNYLGLFK